jgi:hypothetical protein
VRVRSRHVDSLRQTLHYPHRCPEVSLAFWDRSDIQSRGPSFAKQLAAAERVAPRTIRRIQAIQSRGSIRPYLNCDLCGAESSERFDDLLDLSLLRRSEDISHFGLHDIEPGIIEVVRAEDDDLRTRFRATTGLLRSRTDADDVAGQQDKAAEGQMAEHRSVSETKSRRDRNSCRKGRLGGELRCLSAGVVDRTNGRPPRM